MIDDEEALQDNGLIEVDGCNVAECKNFSCGICEEENKIPRTIGHFTADCTFYPNCYFKQLQRAKAENDTLHITIEKLKGDLYVAEDSLKDYQEHYNKLESENEKLKKALEEVKNYCNECNLKADYTACEILTIIDASD